MTNPTPFTRRERRAALRAKAATVLTRRRRQWLYGLGVAFVPFGVAVGWIDPKAAPLILPMLAALFFVDDAGMPVDRS